MAFPHKELSAKWVPIFTQFQAKPFDFKTEENQPKKFIMSMFPYPSADGLHVGHVLGFTGADILARYYKSKGQKVFQPMGFDAFGLPAENFAIKKGLHPEITTQKSIENFTKQLQSLVLDYNWNESVNTSDPSYYKWTQWVFSYLYRKNLAYRKFAKANWCPKCQTVLANEQVIGGYCERHPEQEVIQVELPQWFFKTTAYTEELLNDLENLNWPDKIKLMQKNWIGKSHGTIVKWEIIED